MPSPSIIESYFQELVHKFTTGQAVEHTYRPAFEKPIKELDPSINPLNDPSTGRRISCSCGARVTAGRLMRCLYIAAQGTYHRGVDLGFFSNLLCPSKKRSGRKSNRLRKTF